MLTCMRAVAAPEEVWHPAVASAAQDSRQPATTCTLRCHRLAGETAAMPGAWATHLVSKPRAAQLTAGHPAQTGAQEPRAAWAWHTRVSDGWSPGRQAGCGGGIPPLITCGKKAWGKKGQPSRLCQQAPLSHTAAAGLLSPYQSSARSPPQLRSQNRMSTAARCSSWAGVPHPTRTSVLCASRMS